jgi:hypothetical protein
MGISYNDITAAQPMRSTIHRVVYNKKNIIVGHY